MKKVILFFAIAFYAIAFAQKFDSISVIKESELNKSLFIGKNRNIKFGEFIFKDGTSLKVGDIIKAGPPSGLSSIPNSNGKRVPLYTNIILGSSLDRLFTTLNASEFDIKYKEFKITNIFTVLSMGDINLIAIAIPFNHSIGKINSITISLHESIKNGEIILKNQNLPKEEALKLLEEKKKLLDLGVIKQDEFDKVKEELKPVLLK
ncbi:hypothetical protein [Elizabethkingia sp. M8]|uniref:hypothetical protein n=1 Tax=Elizabethkingia sp. M8 TaxID=2796140 RepID=UPI0019047B59|nr:hypothetical protein [Elizabethkingia sp. M8]QQM25257.1 hypothetical protein JCR23_10090 [Elizabethkingia sp. M8]